MCFAFITDYQGGFHKSYQGSYRKYISGVRVVLWVKGTEYIWVGQLITHQGDMHII